MQTLGLRGRCFTARTKSPWTSVSTDVLGRSPGVCFDEVLLYSILKLVFIKHIADGKSVSFFIVNHNLTH